MNTIIPDIGQEHIKALFEISKEINSVHDLNTLLSRIMDLAMQALDAERGFIILCKGDCQHFETMTVRNIEETEVVENPQYSTSVVRQIIQTQQALLSHDALTDDRFKEAESVLALKIRSMAAVPLKLREQIIGVIYVDSTHNRRMFTEKSLEFLTAFANQAALAIDNARLYEALQQENTILKRDMHQVFPFDKIIGQSAAMKNVFQLMEKVARTDVTVLIEGASGTGKELVARAIHGHGSRKNKPFVGQYCGALQESLLASELFGHRKGAFTGAIESKKGLLEIADGGTFFLDEIADISFPIQTDLLRVIQEGEIKPVGDTRIRKVNVRFISATNKNLLEQVKKGLFREDLYYRLNVISIKMPALNERGDDILLLTEHFLRRYGPRTNPGVLSISSAAQKLLKQYHWPGNVRELENMIQAALVLADQPELQPEHFPIFGGTPSFEGDSLNVNEMTNVLVRKALKKYGGNRTKAAEALGVSVRWLQYRLKELD